MKRVQKEDFVTSLIGNLTDAKSIVLVDFNGLGVKMQQELKKELKKVGATMVVVKNTLFKLASQKAKVPQETYSDTVLTGPTALVIGESDPIAPLQVLAKFAQTNEVPQFKVGIVEGSFQEKESLIRLSTLPGKEVLYAQVVGGISAPLYQIVGTLQGNLQKLLFVLTQASKGGVN